ncbi:MAG: 3-isopropylmalate/(R)-2-methylmalate dehydratase small subunit [Thermosediminibacterales bacterium]|nr:3-isopropylmalate/(R)-2-methylmalate dehydratase small subunit [Thermosediminibacterales bacterium]MDK2835250.1 3-isopropylmalate/(R)-2-methylmalate dehydratase small subunit [Thermosediminibacterales bacterium]
MLFKSEIIKCGDNVDTDVIIPARYLNSSDPKELAAHVFDDLDPNLKQKIKKGCILVAGKNFGCGSSREHAPIAIKASGISCVIAVSFARIFYRNAINIGLPILECKEAVEEAEEGDEFIVDFETGKIQNVTKDRSYNAGGFPPFIKEIITKGGIISFAAERMKQNV